MLQTLLTISILFCKNVKQVKTAFNSDNYRVVRHTTFLEHRVYRIRYEMLF